MEPLASWQDGAWRVYSDWTKAFPPDGKIFARQVPPASSFVCFQVELNQREGGRDRWAAPESSTGRPVEVLDLRSHGEEEARRLLVEDGIEGPERGKVCVVFNEGCCVFVNLAPDPLKTKLTADAGTSGRLEVHTFDTRLFAGEKIRDRWFLPPDQSTGRIVGRVNWWTDSELLRNTLRRLRRFIPDVSSSFSKAQIPSLVSHLSRAALLPADGDDLQAIRKRLEGFVPQLQATLTDWNAVVDVLLKLEPVEHKIEARIEEGRKTREAEVRAKLETELRASMSDLTAEHDRLGEAVTKARDELAALQGRVQDETRHLEAQRRGLASDLRTVATRLSEVPLAADSVADLCEAIASSVGDAGRALGDALAPAAPWSRVGFPSGVTRAWDGHAAFLDEVARRAGFEGEDLALVDVGARAGDIVVLPERSTALVVAYARAVSAREPLRFGVDPSILGLDDLWRRAGGTATALAAAWAAAALDPSRYAVLLLTGINRSPLDLWLEPFVEALCSDLRPRNLLVFATVAARSLDPERRLENLPPRILALDPQPAAGAALAGFLTDLNSPLPPGLTPVLDAPAPSPEELTRAIVTAAMAGPLDVPRLAAWIAAAWPRQVPADPQTQAAEGAAKWAADALSEAATALGGRTRRGSEWLKRLLCGSKQ